MVGWNVAVMQLVAGRVLYEISNLDHFVFVFILIVNDYDEHVEFLYEHMFASVL